jgi:hypothetical protein
MMENLADFFQSPKIAELAIAVLILEVLIISAAHRRSGRGIPLVDMAANALSGIFLLLALYASLTRSHWYWVAGSLGAAFFAHLIDLKSRWRN